MKESKPDRATAIAKELKSIIRKYDHCSFTAHIAFLANHHVRQATGQIKLRSPVRQLMYLMSLYHATEIGGKEYYTAGTDDHRKIIKLLNEIEKGYGYVSEETGNVGVSREKFNFLLVTKGTFLNYHLNANLSYVEQDIERIRRSFQYHQEYIQSQTRLTLDDYINFYLILTRLEIKQMSTYLTQAEDPILKQVKMGRPFRSQTEEQKNHLLDATDKKVYNLSTPLEDIYKEMDKDKARLLLAQFTLLRNENDGYLYYSDECPYLRKPILIMDGDSVLMIYSKQLINAIYDFLYELCSRSDAPGRKISERRDLYLEDKTAEIFKDFFGDEAIIHRSYYANKNEKDLLILHNRIAYVVECKAHKQRTPLRDPDRAYSRINDDFQKSIGSGYLQAKEIETLFLEKTPFTLKNKQKKIIATINPLEFDEVFTIVVTQERLGQIQCDLGLLLKVDEDLPYPWSVCINDLESFLITMKRKANHFKALPEFLMLREMLQERLVCYDELELCANYLFDEGSFEKKCKQEALYLSQPDANKVFDVFYYKGFGFKDELNLSAKLERYDFEEASFVRHHKMLPADRVAQFIQASKKGKPD
jgi:hypothetical protein